MTPRLLADILVLAHLAFVAFVVAGGFLTWRWRPAALAHLPALAWGTWIELSGNICPLTPLENHLRALAGEAGYSGGFIEHYLLPVLYPPGLTRHTQGVLAAVLLVINGVAYAGFLLRSPRGKARPRN
ncbi:MAG: DUF2784 domain-containing protein [Steroidobacteraceae bacterium]